MNSLVIGYGNDLRSDDGAGRVVADRIDALGLPGVTVRSLSQLTPELSLEIAGKDTVIFVDASVEVAETTVTPVESRPAVASTTTHFADPGTLLGMTGTVGSIPKKAYLISIPVADLGLGMELSPVSELGVARAVDLATHLIGE